MRRREFIAGLEAVALFPLDARAQQATGPVVVGVLGAAAAKGYAVQLTALREVLLASGFVEGGNLTIEYRWAEDRFDRLPAGLAWSQV
jgi:putative ABC transport system substrate-binding protein